MTPRAAQNTFWPRGHFFKPQRHISPLCLFSYNPNSWVNNMQKKLLFDVTSRFDEFFFRSKVLFRPIGWFSELNWPFPSIWSFFPHFPLTPQSVHNSKASAGAGHSGRNLFKPVWFKWSKHRHKTYVLSFYGPKFWFRILISI